VRAIDPASIDCVSRCAWIVWEAKLRIEERRAKIEKRNLLRSVVLPDVMKKHKCLHVRSSFGKESENVPKQE